MTSLIAFLTWAFAHSEDFNKVALALVALVGLVLSPMIQLAVVAWQMRIQRRIAGRAAVDNISAKRQVWIDGLRDDVAEVVAQTIMLASLRRRFFIEVDPVKKAAVQDASATAYEKVEVGIARIELRLNPKEAGHQEIMRLIWQFDATAKKFFTSADENIEKISDEFAKQRAELVRNVQGVLKAEWKRIKEARV